MLLSGPQSVTSSSLIQSSVDILEPFPEQKMEVAPGGRGLPEESGHWPVGVRLPCPWWKPNSVAHTVRQQTVDL